MHSLSTPTCRTLLLAILATASLLVDFTFVQVASRAHRAWSAHGPRSVTSRPGDSYSFVGSDYPPALPLSEHLVKMTVEESMHYSLLEPEAEQEWLYTAPIGDNHIRLGPVHRAFVVPMFHELHCLRGLRTALVKGFDRLSDAGREHVNHCFNYLRQWTLCDADVTLEPGDFATRNFTLERVGGTHTCQDWDPTYELVNGKWAEWEYYKDTHDFSQIGDIE